MFNPSMLRVARESRAMTQRELESNSGISQAVISKAQRGQVEIRPEVIRSLAQALGYPESLFSLPESRAGLGISVNFYRKRASSKKQHIQQLEAIALLCRIQAEGLLRDAELQFPYDLERHPIEEWHGSVDELSTFVRSTWQLPVGAIRDLVGTIERAGGVVFKFSFGTRLIDGLSQWNDGSFPLFFINADAPADRVRFSLAHELGHMIMHERPTESMEDEANQFASAFLMPSADIRRDLHSLTLEKAAALKAKWGVSMFALVRRARDLGCITSEQYTDMNITMSKRGYKRQEPYPIPAENPNLLHRVVDAYVRISEYGWDEIAAMCHLLPSEAQQKFKRLDSSFMRLVS